MRMPYDCMTWQRRVWWAECGREGRREREREREGICDCALKLVYSYYILLLASSEIWTSMHSFHVHYYTY